MGGEFMHSWRRKGLQGFADALRGSREESQQMILHHR